MSPVGLPGWPALRRFGCIRRGPLLSPRRPVTTGLGFCYGGSLREAPPDRCAGRRCHWHRHVPPDIGCPLPPVHVVVRLVAWRPVPEQLHWFRCPFPFRLVRP